MSSDDKVGLVVLGAMIIGLVVFVAISEGRTRALIERCEATCAPYAYHHRFDYGNKLQCVCSSDTSALVVKEAE